MEQKTSDTKNASYNFKKKRLPKGKYKNVYPYMMPNGKKVYQAYIQRYNFSSFEETERKAALAVDILLAKKGEKPVNILVKK